MAQSVAFYLLLHQPWRFSIPIRDRLLLDAPDQWKDVLFDRPLNARYFSGVAERSYIPMLTLIEELLNQDFRINLGLSWTFWEQAQFYGEPLTGLLTRVLSHPGVEIVGVEPYHSVLPLIDPAMFARRMRWMRDRWQRTFHKIIRVTDTTEMLYSDQIYWSLASAGFEGLMMDGRPQVVGSEGPKGIYSGPGPLALIPRHWRLSDDVGYRFSNRSWDGFPLMAPTYADWLKDSPGEVVTVGWDFETFGEHHRQDTGIFNFIRQLPVELSHRGCRPVLLSEALRSARVAALTPPMRPLTWAGTGDLDFFLGNQPQWRLFLNMAAAYHKAKLCKQPGMVDVALRLMQSDHLHMLHWYDASGPEADVSAYFTPGEWWAQGKGAILKGLEDIFEVFNQALDALVLAKVPDPKLVASPVRHSS